MANAIFKFLAFMSLGLTALAFGANPKDDDEINYIPKASQFISQREILVPAGVKKVFFQNGLATTDPTKIDGNLRYCFMLLRLPSTKDRVLEKDVAVVTSGSYRSATSVLELEVSQPNGILDIGCISAPKDLDAKTTVGQLKTELRGIFELQMPGPDPIR